MIQLGRFPNQAVNLGGNLRAIADRSFDNVSLMNESISRAAGASHGQEFSAEGMDKLIRSIGREPVQRNTLYARAGQASDDSGEAIGEGYIHNYALELL